MKNLNKMKNTYFLSFFLIAFLITACNTPSKPKDKLTELKKELDKKHTELDKLESKIKELESEIAKLDTTVKKTERLVTVMQVGKKNFEHFVEMQGSVEPKSDPSFASSEMPGRITQLYVQEGGSVMAGQLVAKVDLESMQKQLDELDNRLTLARDLYQRQEALWKQNIGTEVQFLQAKNQVEAIEKSKATIQYQMQKANIYAPTSGVVDKVFVKQGEMAMPSAPIIQIVNFNAVIVKAEVSETYLKTLKLGDVVKIDFPALEQEQTGKIVEIGRAVNPANRTVPVKIDISNARGLIKPNLLANVFIKDVNIGGAIVIPTELIMQETDGRSYVFIKNDTDGTLSSKKVYVETGESYDGQSTITAGLKGGEYLIVKGFKETTDGEWIKILEEEPNPAIMDISEKKRLDKNTPATTNQVQKTVAQ